MTAGGWRGWSVEASAALAVLAVGLVEIDLWQAARGGGSALLVVAVGVALAVALCRRGPAAALGIVWSVGFFQAVTGTPITVAEFALTAVFFGTARWGSPATVVLGGLSLPLAVVVAFVLAQRGALEYTVVTQSVFGDIYARGPMFRLVAALGGLLLFTGPWPAGLALRLLSRASASRASMLSAEAATAGARREVEQAREIARLRDEQARLARDMHDVVGHSLAVILAQAESGQYLEGDARLKATLEKIATSARTSLRDVRQVLSTTQRPAPPGSDSGLDSLIEGARRSGHEIADTELGTRRPLPPEIEAVAYRVLQEMLTNAIRHGRRDRPVLVERHWPTGGAGSFADTLRIEVSNMTLSAASGAPDEPTVPLLAGEPTAAAPGRGLEGMRRRLESVGGQLDVRSREQADGIAFTTTAWVPVRGAVR